MKPIRVGVIGCGYWGPNVIRNFANHPECTVAGVSDVRQKRATRVASQYGTRVMQTADDLIDSPEIDFVAIATPTFTHYELAKRALLAGKHVLVMKPLAASVEEAEELCAIAEDQGRLLAVDHTFVFTPTVQKMKELVSSNALGQLYHFDSVRINLGLFQSDINVIWDLGPHDVSILDFVVGGEPIDVSAIGVAHAGSPTENIAYITLRYPNSFLAHIHVNWLAPAKVRRTILGGSKKMLVYDDVEPSEKIKIYDKGVSFEVPDGSNGDPYKLLVSYRAGDMHAPHLGNKEALTVEIENLVRAVHGQEPLVAAGTDGLRVVRTLEAADRSMRANGAPISLQPHSVAV